MSYNEPYLADLVQFSWKEETTYKTRPTNIDRTLRLSSHNPPWPKRKTEVEYAHGHGRIPFDVNDEMQWTVEGDFTYPVYNGEFIVLILGKCVTTGTDPYTHTITPKNDGMPPSFAVQEAFKKTAANLVQEFLGARVSSATFKFSEDDERLQADVSYLIATPQDGGASYETISIPTTKPYMFKQGVFSSTSLYAGPRARVHAAELKVNNNCKPNYSAGYQHYPYDVLPGKVDYGELKLTLGLEDDTEWDELIGAPGTSYDWEILFTRGANDTLKFSGTARFQEGPPKIEDHDIRIELSLVPITFQCVVVDSIDKYPFDP